MCSKVTRWSDSGGVVAVARIAAASPRRSGGAVEAACGILAGVIFARNTRAARQRRGESDEEQGRKW